MRLLLFFLLLSATCYGQTTTFSGILTDASGEAVAGASVVVKSLTSEVIMSYGISARSGKYSIKFSSPDSLLRLEVRLLGYKMQKLLLLNQSAQLDFVLEEDTTTLDEVMVEAEPIKQLGDTISYLTDAFAQETDRSIADVLKRLPGIDVTEEGKILYQGKPINKYYIEGLDLLGGRYNLANDNLPHKEVSEVQVLENHQPIRVLDSLVFSDQAALNIKLKSAYTVTGQAEAGAGAAPLLWQANVTPMVLSKRQQMLSSYQSNNTGHDVGRQKLILTFDDLEMKLTEMRQQQWVGLAPLQKPPFRKQRWLDNRAHLGSVNYLKKVNNELELRLNSSYYNDLQQLKGRTFTRFFFPGDTIEISEVANNNLYFNSLEVELAAEKNVKKSFLKNSLKLQREWNSQSGSLQLNEQPLQQQVEQPLFTLTNSLKRIFPLGKQLLNFSSVAGFSNVPQRLSLQPGHSSALFTTTEPNAALEQHVNHRKWYTDNTIGFTRKIGSVTLSPEAGVAYTRQQLNTTLFTGEAVVADGFGQNQLQWEEATAYAKAKAEYNKKGLNLHLQLPININYFYLHDRHLERQQELRLPTIEPQLGFTYHFGPSFILSSSGGLNYNFGSINQLHYGYILNNYRSLQRIDSPLPQTRSISHSTRLSYKNPLNTLFINAALMTNNSERNLLYRNVLDEKGILLLEAIAQDNTSSSTTVSAQAGKFFPELRTNIRLSSSYGSQQAEQLFNTETAVVQTTSRVLKAKADVELFNWLAAGFTTTHSRFTNTIAGERNQPVRQQRYLLGLSFQVAKYHTVNLQNEYLYNSLFTETAQFHFVDLSYRFSLKKHNIDVDVMLQNLFDTESYRTLSIDSFRYIETNFALRPRQALVKLRFSL